MPARPLLVPILCLLLSTTKVDAQPSSADDCYVGPGLAATLLFPYFEVDTTDPNGVTTLVAINNGRASPAMTRVIFWTDWGVPSLAFDLYLPGFGVETINVGLVFNGFVPSTGEGVSLQQFPSCDVRPPFHSNPVLEGDDKGQLMADHLGTPGPIFTDCASSHAGDGIARGYITVDVVDECSGLEPHTAAYTPRRTVGEPPYFAEGGGSDGIAISDNRLWGDVIYVNFAEGSAQGSEAVGVWANPEKFTGTDIYTFYGHFSGWDGRDERVPLPNTWNQRFLNGGPFAGGSSFIVWRDVGAGTHAKQCGTGPPGALPLGDLTFEIDFGGRKEALESHHNFPLATQRVSVDSLGLSETFGWLQVLMDDRFIGNSMNTQAWIQSSLSASDLFSANFNATPIGFLCSKSVSNSLMSSDRTGTNAIGTDADRSADEFANVSPLFRQVGGEP